MEFWQREWDLFIEDMKVFAGAIHSVLTYQINDDIEITLWGNKKIALNEGNFEGEQS